MREQEKANERREYSAFFSKFLGLSSRIQVIVLPEIVLPFFGDG